MPELRRSSRGPARAARALGFLALLSVSACTSDVVTYNAFYYPAYGATVLNTAASRGGALVQLVGNPFGGSRAALRETIARHMTGAHFGQPVQFVTQPSDELTSTYRVVWLFDSTRVYDTPQLCEKDPEAETELPRGEGKLTVHAALCSVKRPLSSASGWARDVDSPDDPRFRELIRRVTLVLFPPRNPDRPDPTEQFIFQP